MAATQPFCTSLPALKLIWGIFRSVFPGQSTGRESRLPALRGSLGATGGLALAAQLRAAVSVGWGGTASWGPWGRGCVLEEGASRLWAQLSARPLLGLWTSWPRNVFPCLPPPPAPRLRTPGASTRPFSGIPVARPASSWVAHVPNAPELGMSHSELDPAIPDLLLLQPPSAFPRSHKGFPVPHSLPAHPQSPSVPSSYLG